jgi:hypothetical protein
VALLALRRMPAGIPDLPAMRPALAASTAWLLLGAGLPRLAPNGGMNGSV